MEAKARAASRLRAVEDGFDETHPSSSRSETSRKRKSVQIALISCSSREETAFSVAEPFQVAQQLSSARCSSTARFRCSQLGEPTTGL